MFIHVGLGSVFFNEFGDFLSGFGFGEHCYLWRAEYLF
jgi:hypothetical protein